MKKTVNINVGGYPFIINDDAYDALNLYLGTLHQHFRNSESYDEITGDIEARLAEIFLEKLGSRQILELKDINLAIEIMGRPEDFGATGSGDAGPSMDADGSAYRTGKRLFRDPEDKVFGGVCSGIAAYFGVADPLWVRLFFVVLVFVFGISALFYFVLWIAMPKAVSSADRLAMRGEPVNVSSIAKIVEEEVQNISDSFKEKKNNGSRQDGTKTRTNKFSAIVADALKFLAELLRQIFEVMRLIFRPITGLFGIIFIIILAAVWIVLIVSFIYGHPILNSIFGAEKTLAYLAGINIFFLVASVIGILTIFILRLLFRFRINGRWYGALVGFFFLNCLSLAIAAAGLAKDFSRHSSVKTEVFSTALSSDTINLQVNRNKQISTSDWDNFRIDGNNFLYNGVKLRIKKAEGEEFRLEKEVSAFGRNTENAENNAAQLNYNPALEGNTLHFDESVNIGSGLFRGQTIELTLFVPENKFVRADEGTREIMLSVSSDDEELCDNENEGNVIYRMQNDGQLECLSTEIGKTKILNNTNFNTLKITDLSRVEIKKGITFQVKLEGKDEQLSSTEVVQTGETLVIRNNSSETGLDQRNKRSKVKLTITMPALDLLDIEGKGKVEVLGFSQSEMTLNLFGNQTADLLVDVDNLKLDIDKAKVHLQGKGRKMDARVRDGELKARQYTLKNADITLKSGAEAQIYATENVTLQGDSDNLDISGGAEIKGKREL